MKEKTPYPNRIRLTGPFIDRETMAHLNAWKTRGMVGIKQKLSYGDLIIRVVSFALSEGFDPVLNGTTAKQNPPFSIETEGINTSGEKGTKPLTVRRHTRTTVPCKTK